MLKSEILAEETLERNFALKSKMRARFLVVQAGRKARDFQEQKGVMQA